MTTGSIALFKAMGAKMNYLNERQTLLSENIANADTPDFRPRDLTPVDFRAFLKKTAGVNVVTPDTTNPMHMGGVNDIADPKEKNQKYTYEVAPAGNAVILEEQMINAAKTTTDYNLMTTLYQKNLNMLRTAIGRGQ